MPTTEEPKNQVQNATTDYPIPYDPANPDLENQLYARHAEIAMLAQLQEQRGTPIPAMMNTFYKFIQNPSAVSVETFKRMVDTDDTVGSGVDFLTTVLAARLGRYTHPNQELAAWVNERLEEIEGGWMNAAKEILSAAWAGYYVGEKVWANTKNGFVIQRIASLPPSTILFEVGRDGRLTEDGILQYQRNWNPYSLAMGVNFFGGLIGPGLGWSGPTRPDPYAKLGDMPFPLRTANTFNYLSVRIPKEKCVHYSFDAQGKFGSPYGRSLLRRAYKWWVMKDSFLRMLAVALDRKGSPLTVVYTAPHATVQDERRAQGGNQRGKQGVGMRADQAAAEAFKNIHNDSVIILPGKKDEYFTVDTLSQEANVDGFLGAIRMCNEGIMRALLLPALVFSGGDGAGSYSLGQEHAKTFDKIVDGVMSGVKPVMLYQIVAPMLMYNWPKELWEKDGLGEFQSRELTMEEKQKEAELARTLVDIGAADMGDLGDLNAVRAKAGLPERDEPFAKPPVFEDPFAEPGEEGDEGGGGKNPFAKEEK